MRVNLAENDSDTQKEQESETFHNELDTRLSCRTISPELLEANKIIEAKDRRIGELDIQLDNLKEYAVYSTTMLLLPNNLAMEIYNAIKNAMSSGIVLQFKLKHNGQEITAIYDAQL